MVDIGYFFSLAFFMIPAIEILIITCCVALFSVLFLIQLLPSSSHPSPLGEGLYSIAKLNFSSPESSWFFYSPKEMCTIKSY
jgi:hypothetical protein